jgi:hypothetical protein
MSALRQLARSQARLRSGVYNFGDHPQTNWHRWRDSQIYAAMPPNHNLVPVRF